MEAGLVVLGAGDSSFLAWCLQSMGVVVASCTTRAGKTASNTQVASLQSTLPSPIHQIQVRGSTPVTHFHLFSCSTITRTTLQTRSTTPQTRYTTLPTPIQRRSNTHPDPPNTTTKDVDTPGAAAVVAAFAPCDIVVFPALFGGEVFVDRGVIHGADLQIDVVEKVGCVVGDFGEKKW